MVSYCLSTCDLESRFVEQCRNHGILHIVITTISHLSQGLGEAQWWHNSPTMTGLVWPSQSLFYVDHIGRGFASHRLINLFCTTFDSSYWKPYYVIKGSKQQGCQNVSSDIEVVARCLFQHRDDFDVSSSLILACVLEEIWEFFISYLPCAGTICLRGKKKDWRLLITHMFQAVVYFLFHGIKYVLQTVQNFSIKHCAAVETIHSVRCFCVMCGHYSELFSLSTRTAVVSVRSWVQSVVILTVKCWRFMLTTHWNTHKKTKACVQH